MSARRLATGGRIDRSKPMKFTWDGQELQGFQGDTLASALMANGQRVLGRSFKYHRPRGVMSAGVEESGAIVTLGSGNRAEPNAKATLQELYPGLEAYGQNAWPNVRHDFGAVSGLFSRFFAAGFYYKTFMGLPPFEWGRGTSIWMKYEKLIRKAAGMGTASRAADPDAYDHAHAFCDILVIGAGPAGLIAALTAAKAGKDVLLVEQDFELGGDLLNCADDTSEARRQSLIQSVQKAGLRIMTRTTAFGLYDHGTAGLLEKVNDHQGPPAPYQPRQRIWTVRAQATILATGAIERSIAFGGNDRPGVMSVNAGRAYLNRYGILPGQRIVIATNNDSAYRAARDLSKAGAEITLVDARATNTPSLPDGLRHDKGYAPLQTFGRKDLSAVQLAERDETGWHAAQKLDCDLLLVSGGWSPVVNLSSNRGAAPGWNSENACFLPTPATEPLFSAGAACGIWQHAACEASGVAAAQSALGEPAHPPKPGGWENPIQPIYEVRLPEQNAKSFVDFQHDVTSSDLRLAHQEGFVSVEHMKRYTTLGMATDQGKMGNVIGLALMAEALGKTIPEVGTTRFRPPYTPVAIGAFAGRQVGAHFKALRRTPLHNWNLKRGAIMTDAGLWHRPWYFPKAGETIETAYIREAGRVRETVGVCDVSSLGKIAVQGPDSGEFLNRVYVNGFGKLPVGKARYGVMLRDDGMVMDDGTTWRLGEDEYLMTTTTTNAGKVMVWLEELLQTRWPELRVHLTSVSDQWAAVSVAGPKARQVIADCLIDAAVISAEHLPFMGVTKAALKGDISAWIARISFSGELAFEVFVEAGYGEAMMDLIDGAAKAADGCLYGLEALGTLRIEKGHVTGAELDGRVTLDDAGLGKMASRKKAFIGDALRQRPELNRENRPQLVGIFPKNRSQNFNAGALLISPGDEEGFGEGWVTAVTHSPALGHWIGLGYISGGQRLWADKPVTATDPLRKNDIAVEIVSPHMFDPTGERMHD